VTVVFRVYQVLKVFVVILVYQVYPVTKVNQEKKVNLIFIYLLFNQYNLNEILIKVKKELRLNVDLHYPRKESKVLKESQVI
jgi:hypothetical protein